MDKILHVLQQMPFKTNVQMRLPNFCLPGHAGAELVNLPMSLSGVGLQQPPVPQGPRGSDEGTAVSGRQRLPQRRREGGWEEERGGGSTVGLQKQTSSRSLELGARVSTISRQLKNTSWWFTRDIPSVFTASNPLYYGLRHILWYVV